MTEFLTLVVPGGDAWTYPISHGTQSYQAFLEDPDDTNSRRLVKMPPHVAAHFLLGNSGFSLMTQPAVTFAGDETVSVRHIESPRSLGWGGRSYEPDATGVNHIPPQAMPDAISHGFRQVAEETIGLEGLQYLPIDKTGLREEDLPRISKTGEKIEMVVCESAPATSVRNPTAEDKPRNNYGGKR